MFTMNSPEVPADAAEPLKVVVLAAVSPQAAVSPEAAAVTSAPCAVVATSNAISACHVAVEETITELRIYPVKENVTAVEPLEVSVVSTCELSACPIMAMEGVCERSACPSRLRRPLVNSCLVPNRPWRPPLNSRPVLRPVINLRLIMSWTMNPCLVQNRSRRQSMNT